MTDDEYAIYNRDLFANVPNLYILAEAKLDQITPDWRNKLPDRMAKAPLATKGERMNLPYNIENEITLVPTRVDSGVVYLDKTLPGFLTAMPREPGKLVMGDACGCVLAEADRFEGRLGVFNSFVKEHGLGGERIGELGFNIPAVMQYGCSINRRLQITHAENTERYYDALQTEWVRRINERRNP